ncbi:MAG: family 78 glycoside hydrolase catalytic domain, partial [Bacteroidales bacterium]|nr:family 78 glycoside hydrolase catalytic domain [Bacteroidales bacterium]
ADYHARVWTDYTLKGSKEEVFEPRFFYTGFRYVEVAVSDGAALASLKVEGRVVRSDVEPNGEFTSSNELLNQIHKIGVWAQMGNLVGYPTDCPHREKGAYNGDGQVEAEASMHDFQMASFYTKWLNDMRDSQEPDGRIPNTSPPIVGGMGGGIGWGSAYVLIPWWMYNYYGDTQMLKEHYPTMKRYIAYLKNKARTDTKPEQPYIINYFEGFWYSLGEWCSPGRGDCPNHDVVNTFYYYHDTQLMSQIATMLGHPDDAQQYALLCDTIKQAFNKQFLREETALYGLDSTFQTYQLVALAGDLVPESYKERVMQTIVDDIHKRNNHLNTGIIGTKFLWGQLTEAGFSDLAYSVATQETYPSYGYWIRNNSTTLLEDWQGGASHNHQMFGSVTEFFYKYLAGIQSPVEGRTTPGYKHIHLQPYMPDGLNSAEASLGTVSGKIVAGWEKQNGQYVCHAVIPANTTATLVLPVGGFSQLKVTESGKDVWENATFVSGSKGIREGSIADDKLTISLESGEYRFVVFGELKY